MQLQRATHSLSGREGTGDEGRDRGMREGTGNEGRDRGMREGTGGEAVRTLCGGDGPLVAHTQVAEELQEARVAGLHQPLQHEVDL